MSRQRLLVVGNGMAGLRFLEQVVETSPDSFAITVIGAEPEPAYNRVLLSQLLAGEIGAEDVQLRPRGWYDEHGIALLTGEPAVAIDPAQRAILLRDREAVPFDALVLATGSRPIRLMVPGSALDGVMTLRTLGDVAALTARANRDAPVAVIGGGLLGIEAAYGLARAGLPVTLVHLMDRLMERQLDAEGARFLQQAIEAKGIRVLLNAETAAIHGRQSVEMVELGDGRRIMCGLVVMAVGIAPNAVLAATAGIRTGRGVLVDDGLATSMPGVYAIGECAEHRGTCYGLVDPAYEQARVLAQRLAGAPAGYTGSVLATNLKVSGVAVFSAGDFASEDAENIVLRDAGQLSYRKLVIRDERLAGAVLVGDTGDALWHLELIRSQAPVAGLREALAFGRGYAEAA